MMVPITGPNGKAIENGKIGFLVKELNEIKKNSMALGMKRAHGASIDFVPKDPYIFKTKAVIVDKKLFDQFD